MNSNKIRPEEMLEGRKYTLIPNEEYSATREKIWYTIRVIESYDKEVHFEILDSNAEHTIGRKVLFGFDHAIFRVRNVYPRATDSFEGRAVQEKRPIRHKEEPSRPIHTYKMSPEFKKVLIDIALMDNDENWFKELTGASQVG